MHSTIITSTTRKQEDNPHTQDRKEERGLSPASPDLQDAAEGPAICVSVHDRVRRPEREAACEVLLVGHNVVAPVHTLHLPRATVQNDKPARCNEV